MHRHKVASVKARVQCHRSLCSHGMRFRAAGTCAHAITLIQSILKGLHAWHALRLTQQHVCQTTLLPLFCPEQSEPHAEIFLRNKGPCWGCGLWCCRPRHTAVMCRGESAGSCGNECASRSSFFRFLLLPFADAALQTAQVSSTDLHIGSCYVSKTSVVPWQALCPRTTESLNANDCEVFAWLLLF